MGIYKKHHIDKTYKYKTLFFQYRVRFVQYKENDSVIHVNISRVSIFYSLICRVITPMQEMKYAKKLNVLNLGFIFNHKTTLDTVYKEYNLPDYMLCEEKLKLYNRRNKIKLILK